MYFYAFSDLLVGLISVLTDIIWRYSVAWYAGNLACKIVKFAQVVVTYSSTYVLVALSIDRYDAITRPMNFSRSCEYPSNTFIALAELYNFGISIVFVIVFRASSNRITSFYNTGTIFTVPIRIFIQGNKEPLARL